MNARKPERPLFVLWDYETHGPEGDKVSFRKKRHSTEYLALAEYFVNNPPDMKPFHPRDDLGVAAHALQTYRDDVETWVSMRMMTAILEDEEYDDADIFPRVIAELHKLPWYPGAEWKGFYYVQPMVNRIRPAEKQSGWAFDAIGKNIPYMKAEGLKGYWYEPKLEESEQWKTRLAVNNLRRSVERFAESALSGRSIGQLKPAQHWYLVNAAVNSIQKALPPTVVGETKKVLTDGDTESKES